MKGNLMILVCFLAGVFGIIGAVGKAICNGFSFVLVHGNEPCGSDSNTSLWARKKSCQRQLFFIHLSSVIYSAPGPA